MSTPEKINRNTKLYKDILNLNSYEIKNEKITRIKKDGTGTLIDHVITPTNINSKVKTKSTAISDHKSLYISINLPTNVNIVKSKKIVYKTDNEKF